MIPQNWKPPCNYECTLKYSSFMQIPWRVFCKKGCDADGDTFEECLSECDQMCYKDPVVEDHQWSSYIDRSPGAVRCSEECFHACKSGCGYKFDIHPEKVKQVNPNRPSAPPPMVKHTPAPVKSRPFPLSSFTTTIPDIPSTSA